MIKRDNLWHFLPSHTTVFKNKKCKLIFWTKTLLPQKGAAVPTVWDGVSQQHSFRKIPKTPDFCRNRMLSSKRTRSRRKIDVSLWGTKSKATLVGSRF